jgi:hypothetical protein
MMGDMFAVLRSKYKCPQCGHYVGWLQRGKLSPWGVRKIMPCPSCSEPLEWSKWPFRVFEIGFLTMCVAFAAGFLSTNRVIDYLIMVGVILEVLGFCFNRVEHHKLAH